MKRMLAVALLLATTGCIDVPAMNGLMDRLVPELEIVYQEVELDRFEGEFKPDPDQNEGALGEAFQTIINDPSKIGTVVQNLSWVEYTYHFVLPPGATGLRINITIDYTLFGSDGEPDEGPAGTLDLTIHNPEGDEMCRDEAVPPCFEIVNFNDNKNGKEIDGYSARPAPMSGEWTLTISGSGMEGVVGELFYFGTYNLIVTTELPTR